MNTHPYIWSIWSIEHCEPSYYIEYTFFFLWIIYYIFYFSSYWSVYCEFTSLWCSTRKNNALVCRIVDGFPVNQSSMCLLVSSYDQMTGFDLPFTHQLQVFIRYLLIRDAFSCDSIPEILLKERDLARLFFKLKTYVMFEFKWGCFNGVSLTHHLPYKWRRVNYLH